jgi:formamidopyrimidine-DNA glycosylase
MPELPEVEMVRRQLKDKITDKTIAEVDVKSWKSVKQDRYFQKALAGQKIVELSRKGKYLFFTLTDTYLIGHLKMTGRLIFKQEPDGDQVGGGHALRSSDAGLKPQPHEHTRIIFVFEDGSRLYFNDVRKFGYITRAKEAEVASQKQKLGREPLADDYSLDYFADIFADRQTSVKAVLLKQSDIAGLGNIYVDEACFRAGIRPDRTAGNLTDSEITRLHKTTNSVLEDALKFGGTTFRDYVDTDGTHGNFTDKLAVFGRDGDQCVDCSEEVKKMRVAGRGTHLCPACQE